MTVHHTMSRIYRTWGRSPLVSPARTIWPPGHSSISRKQLVTGDPNTENLGTPRPITAAKQIIFHIFILVTTSIKSNVIYTKPKEYFWEHKFIIKIDQQSTLFFLLSWPTFPLSRKWGDFVDWRKFSLNDFVIIEFKILHEDFIIK